MTDGVLAADALPRRVLVHYHLFKNAGTSVDRALQASFGARWASVEATPGERRLEPAALRAALDGEPAIDALSSHTARLRPWAVEGIEVFPAVFLRHPLDRMMSAYEFERKQKADTPGARRAKTMSFAQYVDFFVSGTTARTFRNFQAHRLAEASQRRGLPVVEKALDAVERLPFVGIVEEFDVSIARLERLARPWFPSLALKPLRANTGSRRGTLDEKLDSIRAALGRDLYKRACHRNLKDLVVWEHARLVQAWSRGACL